MEAINLYMKAGLPARAARLALSIDVSIRRNLTMFFYFFGIEIIIPGGDDMFGAHEFQRIREIFGGHR